MNEFTKNFPFFLSFSSHIFSYFSLLSYLSPLAFFLIFSISIFISINFLSVTCNFFDLGYLYCLLS